MKIGLICTKCAAEADRGAAQKPNKIFVDVQDVGIYDLTCSRGHRTKVLLQDLKHELLFESGAIALIDGYAREAVASFAASVERFHEFVVRVLLKAAKIGSSEMDGAWKRIKAQSERQFGAVIFVHLVVNGKSLPDFDNKWVEFRNRVIHQGDIPTVQKAAEYGDYCLQYIFATLNGFGAPCRVALSEVFKEHVQKTQATAGTEVIRSHHLRQPLIQTHAVGSDFFGKYTLQQWIDSVVTHLRPEGSIRGTSL
jgi:hypothetical protein